MELKDGSQEMATSPSTPATVKSKLDTLTREDLIKFSKKQMILVQKAKSRCTELEKEIEELKTKPVAGQTDDIIQMLRERLDAVLLEKAETQQQCLNLKKENVKRQQEVEAAIAKEEELQKKFAQSTTDYLKEVEGLKHETVTAQRKYDEAIASLKKELHDEIMKQEQLTEQLEFHNSRQGEIKRLQEEIQQTKTAYEQQIVNLKKQLEASSNDKEEETIKLQGVIESNSQYYQNEIDKSVRELEKLKATHQLEVSDLMQQLETSSKVCEEQNKVDQLIQEYKVKENHMQAELNACKEKYESELENIRQILIKSEENQTESRNVQLETEMAEKARHLENTLKELESQHSILQDELTYMNNVKMKLEVEIQHAKDEYFHEREDLEFKINELQLAREDHCSIIEKLKSELQTIRQQQEQTMENHSLEIQDMVEKHRKEICELKQTLSSSSEEKSRSLFLEIQGLKEQCQKHIQEKEEAIASYESLRETLETLQTELGESAGKISQEFQSMKQQQAADVDELQKKLRAAFNEKDVLLETVNRLQNEVEQLSSKREEMEELRDKTGTLQEENEKLLALLHQREAVIKDLEEKEKVFSLQNNRILAEVKCSAEEMESLQEERRAEQGRVMELQQHANELSLCNQELKQQAEKLAEELKRVSEEEEEENEQKLRESEQKIEALQQQREGLLSEVESLQGENNKIKEERDQADKELESVASEKANWLVSKEQVHSLEMKLQMACEERASLTQLLEEEKAFKILVMSQLHSFLGLIGLESPEENEGNTVTDLMEVANESLAKMKEEKQSLISLKDEHVLLRQEMKRIQEESAACCTELRSLLDDSEKEKCLLRKELEGVLSEKEALQLAIQELQHVNEKVRNENQDLLTRIEDVSEKLTCHQSTTKEQEKRLEEERNNLNSVLEQKETELKTLQSELSLLKISVEQSSANCDKSSDTEKTVNLEKRLQEKEEKLNKFKAVAVKLRKELDSSRKEVQSLREELEVTKAEKDKLSTSVRDVIQGAESYKNLLVAFDKQAEQLDFEKERSHNFEHQISDLARQLEVSLQQQEQLRSANEDLTTRIETLQTNTKLLETQLLEIQKAKAKVDKEFESEKLLKEQKIQDHISAAKDVEELQAQLQKEKKHLQKILEELELAKKDAQKSTLMDMEMADYQRLVKELNQKITDKNSRIEEFEQEMKIQKQKEETLQEEIKSCQTSVQQYEEENSKIKQLLVKTRKELTDSKQSENELLRFQASLKGEMEASQQQVEVYKIQLAELTSEKHKIQEHLRSSVEQHQRVVNSYQQRIAALQEECDAAKAEHSVVTSEFESYKVRVHNVLKQKNKSASQAKMDVTKQERERMEKIIDQLKNKLQDAQQTLQISASELQVLQTEHDTLLERHNKILQETVAKEAELREKLCTIQSENMVMKSEHTQTVSQLTAQNEALRNSFRDQVRHLQEEHRKTVETLQQQLSKLEAQLNFQLKSEPSTKSPASSNLPTKNLRERRSADLPLLDVHSVAREEGEGMETTDTESISSTSTYVPYLEQLLNTPDTKFEPPQWQTELSKEEMVQQLNTISKSADHLNGLLRESEATNAILMEQIKLLKSEIRRLERNQEREKSVANLEYLKNVLLQFIFLKSGSERQRLLPVIDTMLQLSPEEKEKLVAIAQGEEDSTSQSSGWASYLHSWSGLR